VPNPRPGRVTDMRRPIAVATRGGVRPWRRRSPSAAADRRAGERVAPCPGVPGSRHRTGRIAWLPRKLLTARKNSAHDSDTGLSVGACPNWTTVCSGRRGPQENQQVACALAAPVQLGTLERARLFRICATNRAILPVLCRDPNMGGFYRHLRYLIAIQGPSKPLGQLDSVDYELRFATRGRTCCLIDRLGR